MGRFRAGRHFRALAVVLGAVALTGCAAPGSGDQAAPGWDEPGWMAQVREQDEAYQSAMISCYAEYGLEAARSIGGGGVGFVNLADDSGQMPPGVADVLETASADCNARVPLPDHRASQTFDDASYQRLLELRACIAAHGYDVPEAPSAETWKDSEPSTAWNPYSAMFAGTSGTPISQDELRSLMAACPQSGPSYYIEAPTDGDG